MTEKWSEIGAESWDDAVPTAGTLADVYLKSRGISLQFGPEMLRFHPAAEHPKLKTKMPALIAKVSGATEPSHHFTWLAPDGKAKALVEKKEQRRTLGSNKNGAVHLGEPKRGKPLLVGEGIETVATSMEATGLPGWASLGATQLPNIEWPEDVTEIIHLAENDDNGANQRALDKACPVLSERGVRSRIASPPAGYKDFNDLVKGGGLERSSGLMIVKMAVEAATGWKPKAKAKSKEQDLESGEFLLNEAGLHRRKNKKWDWIAQPFEMLGLARDAATDEGVIGWGKFLRFKNPDELMCEEIVATAMLHDDPNALISRLADRGMKIKCTAAARRSFAEYLASAEARERVTVARRIGWIELGSKRAFVLPGEIVGGDLSERVILAKEAGAPYGRRGTLDDWRRNIAEPAGDHRMLRFSISTALAGPLLLLGAFESGLFHFFGYSSEGKTTCLRVDASVWGSGADGGYLRTWRATANGLEATLASACDTSLPLDEIAQADGREIGHVVYMITGALGKTRMRPDASLKPSHKWRVLALSSGETPMAVRFGEEMKGNRRGAYAGQLVRALDIPARHTLGVFDRPYPNFDPKAFADKMKSAASTYYGTAGPEFVRALIERGVTGRDVRQLVDVFVGKALAGVTDNKGQAARAAERFGLVAAAGELAVEFGLVAWSKGKSIEDAAALFLKWLDARGGTGPAEIKQMIAQVRRFLESHGDSRFDDITTTDPDRRPVANRAGYRRDAGDDRRWLVLPQVWREEICAGFDPKEVAKLLSSLGMLEKGEGDNYAQNIRLPSADKTQRFYVLTPAVFEGWGEGKS